MKKIFTALVAAVSLSAALVACAPAPAPVAAPVPVAAPAAPTDSERTAALVYCVQTAVAEMPNAEWVDFCTPVHDAVNIVRPAFAAPLAK